MRYRLRELMVLVAVGPPLLAGLWFLMNLKLNRGGNMPLASTRTRLGLLEEAVLAYSFTTRQLPPDLEALVVPPADLADPAKWQGPYLDRVRLPVDSWDQEFRYEVIDAKKLRFRIWSMGPDRVSGSRDDVVMEH